MSTALFSTTPVTGISPPVSPKSLPLDHGAAASFFPQAPETVRDTGLVETEIESLILKAMLATGSATGRSLAEQMRLPGHIVRSALDHLRAELLITHRGSSDLVDFIFQLTEVGAQRAKQYAQHSTYCGSAPVPLEQYIQSVSRQSVRLQKVNLEQFRQAFAGLYLDREVFGELAQAVNAGRGLFLFGNPGNGKTSVAERLARSFSNHLWIPRTISVGGDVLRLFDSSVHREIDPSRAGLRLDIDQLDRRWVLIERPTIVVGGELVLAHLEIGSKLGTTVLEAPVQMKANGGVLVIDDFGRQRVSPVDILNRWIVPLDRGVDYLTLPNGRQIVVPFDQNLILATNLLPKDLMDEAFLRRIPFKIQMPDPHLEAFVEVFCALARQMQLECSPPVIHELMAKFYQPLGLPMRFCHPRDLLFHVDNICNLYELPRCVTTELLELAARNYFHEVPRRSVKTAE